MARSKTYELMLRIGGKADSSLRKACEAADAQLAGLGETAEKIMSAAGTAMKTLGAAAVAGITASATSYAEYEQAAKNLTAATGATGKELENQEKAMKAVYKSGYGEDLEEIAETIAIVERNVDNLSGKWTETAENAKAAIALEKTFGYGTEETTRAASALMKNFGGDAATNMSLIAAGAQKGLDFSGELIDTVSEYSSQFSKLGFTADGMFNLLQSGADSTAWNLDKVGDAIKEFSIRSIDGSKTTTEAFQTLGFDHNAMMQTFAAGGESANAAFFQVLNSLLEMDDLVKRDAVGVALFGTMWEDLGAEAMQAMANASQGAYDTQNALAQIQKTSFSGLTNSFEKFKRTGKMILVDVGEKLAPMLQSGLEYVTENIMPKILPMVERAEAFISGKVIPTCQDAWEWIQKNEKVIKALAIGVGTAVVAFKGMSIVSSITGVLKAAGGAGSLFTSIIGKLPMKMMGIAGGVGVAIAAITLLYQNWDKVKAWAENFGAKVDAVWANLSAGVQNAIAAISERCPFLGAALDGVWTSVSNAWENVKGIFSGVIDFVDNVFSGNWQAAWTNIVDIFGNVFGALGNLALIPINAVISMINSAIEKVNSISITIPDWVPSLGGKTFGFSIPTIPQLATGGIAVAPTLAQIGEGGEPEAVLPLSKLASMLGTGAFGGGGNWTFAPNIVIQGNANRQDVEDAIRMSFEEFKRMWRQLQEEEKRKKFY